MDRGYQEMGINTLAERVREIELLMRYGVPAEHFREARELVEKYAGDTVALNILHNFYSFLPEAYDDGIRVMRLLARRQGAFLICASTFLADYLYIATSEQAVYLGRLEESIQDREVLEFFDFADALSFAEKTKDLNSIALYSPANLDPELCPVCGAACGEYHTLGCPVEICPWCQGQLTRCNCRFAQLGTDRLSSEEEIEQLREKIEARGRIPFDKGQAPAYLAFEDPEVEME